MNDRELDITGRRFGRLTVIRYDHSAKHKSYWLCRCDCGKDAVVNRYRLTSGATKSCGCLRSDSARMVRGRYHKVEVPESAKKWIIRHFKHTRNDEMKEKFGLSDGWLHRFAREHGLRKSRQFMAKCQAATAAAAKESHIIHGTYPPKGYVIPGSRENRFKPGETNLMRMGKKKEAERIRKSAEARRATFKLEHARATFGLPRETKLRVLRRPHFVTSIRRHLRSRGYEIAWGSDVAYYDGNTRRSERIESRKPGDRNYYRFEFRPKEEIG